jgi:hypothetical protein
MNTFLMVLPLIFHLPFEDKNIIAEYWQIQSSDKVIGDDVIP